MIIFIKVVYSNKGLRFNDSTVEATLKKVVFYDMIMTYESR